MAQDPDDWINFVGDWAARGLRANENAVFPAQPDVPPSLTAPDYVLARDAVLHVVPVPDMIGAWVVKVGDEIVSPLFGPPVGLAQAGDWLFAAQQWREVVWEGMDKHSAFIKDQSDGNS